MKSPHAHGDVPEASEPESLAPAKKAAEPRGEAPWGPRSKYIFVSPAQPGRETAPENDLGLIRRLVAADSYARFQRHRTPDVWFPIGVDACGEGLLSEASRRGLRPEEAVRAHCDRIRSAAQALAVEPSGELVSTGDPSYVRLTQWIFLELLAKGLIRWADCRFDGCPACGGRFRQGAFASCPRCGGPLERREVRERRLDVAAYGDRLLGDLEGPDRRSGPRSVARRGAPQLAAHRSVWSPRDRKLQREILGRVKGCEVRFPVSRPFELEYRELVAFTTRVELLYGVTFVLVEPYHPLLPFLVDAAYEEEVERYRERLRKGAEPRLSAVRTGGHALNPLSLERVPILASALAWAPGTGGVVLGIPGHDAELFELAKRLRLPVREVVHSDAAKFDHRLRLQEPWLGDGVLTNSGPFCGLSRKVARERVISALARKGACRKVARFRFASLPVSAESTLGPPVPVVRCPSCGDVPVPEAELPLLPRAESPPAGERGPEGEPVACPRCGKEAARDPERILPWLGEAWSYVRLALPHLGGALEGFRDLSAAPQPPAPPSSGPGTPPAAAPEEGQTAVAEARAAESPAGAAPPQPPSSPPLPEDVDVFRVPPKVRTEDDGIEWQVGVEDVLRPGASEKPPEAPVPLASAPATGAAGGAPEGASAAEEALAAPPEGEPRAPEAPGAGAAIEEEEEEPEPEELFQASRLKPFRSDCIRRLPAELALLSNALSLKHLVGLRLLGKVLHDLGHVPSHLPFLHCIRTAPLVWEGDRESLELLEHPERLGRFGGDAVRMALLFAGPLDEPGRAGARGARAMHRFLERIWKQMGLRRERGKFVSRRMLVEKHRLIYEITRRLGAGKFHTAVAALMAFVKFLEDPETAPEDMDREAMSTFIVLLSPFAPRLARELWAEMGRDDRLEDSPWPVASEELIHPPDREYLIFVDGKLCDRMMQPADLEPEKLESRALQRDRVREVVANRKVVRVVTVPAKLVSIALAPPPPAS